MISQSYANDKSFATYREYLALKKHFTTKNYDYHKYNGKVRASFDTFRTRNDVFFFYKLSQKKNSREMILSNLIKDPRMWVRDILEESGQKVFQDWQRRIESLTYNFKIELNSLKENYKENFLVQGGQHPYLMVAYLQKRVSLETFTILSNISKVTDYWEKQVVDKVVAGDIINLSRKYYPFLDIDEKKFSAIVKDKFF